MTCAKRWRKETRLGMVDMEGWLVRAQSRNETCSEIFIIPPYQQMSQICNCPMDIIGDPIFPLSVPKYV